MELKEEIKCLRECLEGRITYFSFKIDNADLREIHDIFESKNLGHRDAILLSEENLRDYEAENNELRNLIKSIVETYEAGNMEEFEDLLKGLLENVS